MMLMSVSIQILIVHVYPRLLLLALGPLSCQLKVGEYRHLHTLHSVRALITIHLYVPIFSHLLLLPRVTLSPVPLLRQVYIQLIRRQERKPGVLQSPKQRGGGAAATAAPTTSAATTIRILTNSSSSSSAAVLGGGKNKGGVLGGGSSASGVQCHSHLRFFSHLPPYDRSICPMSSFETDGKAPVFQSSIPGGGKRRKHQKGIGWKRDFKEYPLQTRIAMDFKQDLVHPAVIRIGLQMGKRKVTGTNARTVAMLTAFQRFIEDYCPAPYEAIEKHLKITLDRQINFITHCRPHSLAMGGVIRWLKRRLSRYATMPLQDTKMSLCTDISTFIRERILVATCAVADGFQSIIEPGDCLMVFGKSTAVLRALLEAKKNGFRFSVVVVDSHPHLNGQVTARICAAAGIEVSYTLLNGISYHIEDVTKVVLGAAALLANASVVGRAGSAVVAMEGKVHAKPVLVLCESYKMFDKIVLDSCSFNELDDPQLVWERAKSPPHAFSEDVPIYYPSSSSHMPLSQTRRSSQAGEEKEHDGEGGFDEGDVRMNERERKEREGEHASHHKTASHKVKGGSPFLASCIPSSPLLRNDESPAIPSQEKSSSASSSSRRRRKSGAEEKTVFSPSFCDSSSSSSSSSKTPDIGRREPGGEGEQED
ncbi:initiation subunit 2 family protein, partial [Cystoisospora suis]